jgi:ketosteroid isomerase-like protein
LGTMLKRLSYHVLPLFVLAFALIILGFSSVNVRAANPAITLSPSSGPPGVVLTVTGSSFASHEIVTLTFDGITINTISAEPDGTWRYSFAIPDTYTVSHTITVFGSLTPAGNAPSVIFRLLTPSLAISPPGGPPGTRVTVTGSGFIPGETGISLTDDSIPVVSNITADSLGNWTGTFTIPSSSSGSHAISAYGATASATFVSATTFIVRPALALGTASGPPGTQVLVSGSGFGVSETGISITYDGSAVAADISADNLGNWRSIFIVPPSNFGSHPVSAYGSVVSAGSLTGINFIVEPAVIIDIKGGAPGAQVAVTGSGFISNETGIAITWDGSAVVTGISAAQTGSWSGTLTVPPSPSGSHAVSAYGSATLPGSVPAVTFSVSPAIILARSSGSPGSQVTLSGSGFADGETVSITFDGFPLAPSLSANSLGNWTGTITVPASASGTHVISAYGTVNRLGKVSGIDFKVQPGVSLSPPSGHVGGSVRITGLGFAANSNIKFTFDGQQLLPEATANITGTFISSFSAPKSRAGNHIVAVVDSEGHRAEVAFHVDSASPLIPAPRTPKDGSTVQIFGESTPTLTWANVVDSSGAVYALQVSSTPDFSHLVLEKTGIPINQYVLTSAEALPRGRYYWRVKAVDGASNESAWSPVRSFKSGIVPLWAWLLVILLGAGVVGIGFYFRRRRPVVRPKEAIVVPEFAAPRIVPGHWRVGQSEETPADGTKIVRDFIDALHQKDLDKALALYEDDADMVTPEGAYHGRPEIQRYWTRVFATDSGLNFTDAGIGIMVQGNKAVYEYLVSGAVKGKGWQRPALDVYEFNNGKVRRHRIVYGRLVPAKKKP